MLIPIGFFGGGGGGAWISMFGDTAAQYAGGIGVDASGNVYSNVTGTPSNFAAGVVKYTPDGQIAWQKSLWSTTQGSLVTDAAGNSYLCSTMYDETMGGNQHKSVYAVDTNGDILWQRKHGIASYAESGGPVAVDSSGRIYTAGNDNQNPSIVWWSIFSANAASVLLSKYNYNYEGTYGEGASNIYAMNDGTHFFASNRRSYGDYYRNTVFKYDINGNLVWGKYYQLPNTNSFYHFGSNGDSSGNYYITGRYSYVGDYMGITKINGSDGSIAWSKKIGNSGEGGEGYWMCTDSAGNVYHLGSNGETACGIAKYNSSGVLQWQRKISNVDAWGRITCNDTHFFINANTSVSGNSNVVTIKLPTDGSGIGTASVGGYSFVYAASNLPVTDAPLNVGTDNRGSTGLSKDFGGTSRAWSTTTQPQSLGLL